MVGGDSTMLSDVLLLLLWLILAHSLSCGFIKGASNRLRSTGVNTFLHIGLFGFLNERKGSRSLALLAFRSSYQILD